MKIIRFGNYAAVLSLMLHYLGAGAPSASLCGNFTFPGDLKNGYSGYTITLDKNWHPQFKSGVFMGRHYTAESPTFFDAQGDHFDIFCSPNTHHANYHHGHSVIASNLAALSKMKTRTKHNKLGRIREAS